MEAQTLDRNVHLVVPDSMQPTSEDFGIAAVRYCFLTLVYDVRRNVKMSNARENILADALRVALLADTGSRGRHGGSCWERRRRLTSLQSRGHVV